MFKKIVKVISVAAVLATAASAMDFCKTADNLFLKNGLEKKFFKFNNREKLGAACEINMGSPVCVGHMKAFKMLADNAFNTVGYENAITLLNKYGVKKQYNKTQIYINYSNFFVDYLKNKLKSMNEAKRKIFLEKMFLFFNRTTNKIINFNDEQLVEVTFSLALQKIFKKPLFDAKNINAAKEVTNLGATAYIANKQLKGVNAVEGKAILAFHPDLNLKHMMSSNMEGYSSKDPRLGGSADNLEKFFVYAATKQYKKAFDLINNTYSDEFIKEFNKEIKEVCKIK